MLECEYCFHYFRETNVILIFVKLNKFICVGVPEWLSGLNRNHVVFVRVGHFDFCKIIYIYMREHAGVVIRHD